MPFAPGNQHGKNATGRPRVRDALSEAVRRKYPPEKIIELVEELFAKAEDDATRRWAIQFVADRGYGKAKETVEVKTELTEQEYAEELAIIAREHLNSLPADERARLLEDPAPTDTIQ